MTVFVGMEEHRLGFLTRADRVLFAANSSSGDAGPGAYYQTQFQTGPENFAPFGSTAKRETKVPVQSTPPPGAYDAESFDTVKSKPQSRSAGILRSKTKRFKPEKAPIGPGPGTYALKPAIEVSKKKTMPKSRSAPSMHVIGSLQSPCAPSIPTKYQSFGYEEDETGRLKPQEALQAGFTGAPLDSVGPGDYDPRPLSKPKSMANFAKGTNRLTGQRPVSNPGPGYYNYKSSFESLEDDADDDGNFYLKMAQAQKKPLSSFVSTSRRSCIEGKIDPTEPGPMSYDVPRTGIQIKKKNPKNQCFDSSAKRFADPTPKSQQTKTNASSYKPLSSDFDSNRLKILRRKRMTARSGWAQNISFQSTEERFFQPSATTDGPVPGHYVIRDGIGDIKFKNQRSGPFGSSLQRFTYTGDHPPSYRVKEQEDAFHVYADEPKVNKSMEPPKRSPVKPSRVFVSNEQRFQATKEIHYTPAPGTYTITSDWGGKGVVPMKERQCKSVLPLEVKLPGPGDYDAYSNDGRMRSTTKKPSMGGTASRFLPERQSDVPPPGSYNLKSGLILPTHNVCLSAEY